MRWLTCIRYSFLRLIITGPKCKTSKWGFQIPDAWCTPTSKHPWKVSGSVCPDRVAFVDWPHESPPHLAQVQRPEDGSWPRSTSSETLCFAQCMLDMLSCCLQVQTRNHVLRAIFRHPIIGVGFTSRLRCEWLNRCQWICCCERDLLVSLFR